MSATSRPDWGRASGALSILTAIDGREAVAPVGSGRPVSGARAAPAVVTVPSDSFVSGVTAATGFGSAPPPQAAGAREARPIRATAVRRNGTGDGSLLADAVLFSTFRRPPLNPPFVRVSKARPCCYRG